MVAKYLDNLEFRLHIMYVHLTGVFPVLIFPVKIGAADTSHILPPSRRPRGGEIERYPLHGQVEVRLHQLHFQPGIPQPPPVGDGSAIGTC